MRTKGHHLLLAGGRPRGTLYAVETLCPGAMRRSLVGALGNEHSAARHFERARSGRAPPAEHLNIMSLIGLPDLIRYGKRAMV